MAYNSKIAQKVLSEFENKEKAAVYAAEKRKEELYKILPELRRIDEGLAMAHIEIAGSVMNPGGDINIKLENIKNKNKNLQQQRKLLLEENNYAADYTEPVYECGECGDSGDSEAGGGGEDAAVPSCGAFEGGEWGDEY